MIQKPGSNSRLFYLVFLVFYFPTLLLQEIGQIRAVVYIAA